MSVPPTRWLARLLGRRGAALAILGLAFFVIGITALAGHGVDTGRFLLYEMIPPTIRAVLWMTSGALALTAALRRSGRDTFGFVALVVPLMLQAVSFAWSTVGYALGATAWPWGWANAAIWVLLLSLVLLIAGWAEPGALPPHRHRAEDPRA